MRVPIHPCCLLLRPAVLLLTPIFLAPVASAQARGDSAITTVAGNGTAGYVAAQDGGLAIQAELDEPFGTAVDAMGNLYIADRANNRIRRVDAATGIITTVNLQRQAPVYSADPETDPRLNGPRAVALDPSGNLYIADTQNQRVLKLDAAGILKTIAGTGTAGYRAAQEGRPARQAQLDSPSGVAVDAAGNVYIADYNNQRVRRIDAVTSIITTVAGTGDAGYMASQDGGPATAAELNHPGGIAVDGTGNLYIADTDNHRIRKVDASTRKITTVAGSGTAGYSVRDEGTSALRAALNAPCGVAIDAHGNLYIADYSNNRIRKVTATTNIITTLAGNGIAGYIASEDGGAATSARLDKPRGVAVDGAGNVFISDYNNSRVRKVAAPGSLYLAGR